MLLWVFGIDIEAKMMPDEMRDKMPDDMFALIQNKDGKKIRRYPINDEEHVRMAWQMADKGMDMTPEERAQMKRMIQKRAKEMNMDTSGWEKGDVKACSDLELEASGFKLNWSIHPNKIPFEGVLFLVDEASDRPPNGTDGRKLYVPKDVAAKALETIVGMPVNANLSLNDHDAQKVGVITAARIDGNKFRVFGHMFGKDFPDVVKAIKAHRGEIGMSMETARTLLEDYNHQGEVVAKALSLVFTGGAILLKNAAAYRDTDLAASLERSEKMKELLDAITNLKADIAASIANEVQKAIDAKLPDLEAKAVAKAAEALTAVNATVTELKAKVDAIKVPEKKDETPTRKTASGELIAKYQKEGKDVFSEITGSANLSDTDKLALKIMALGQGLRQS